METLALHWDGTVWSVVATPNVGSGDKALEGVSCTAVSTCVAVGEHDESSTVRPLLLRWDGAVWSTMAEPTLGPEPHTLTGVSCLAGDDCVAVGVTNGPPDSTLILRWDGVLWSQVPSPNPGAVDNVLSAVWCSAPGRCTAVGLSFDFSSQPTLIVQSVPVAAPAPLGPTYTG
jgi:hypothetical protein